MACACLACLLVNNCFRVVLQTINHIFKSPVIEKKEAASLPSFHRAKIRLFFMCTASVFAVSLHLFFYPANQVANYEI